MDLTTAFKNPPVFEGDLPDKKPENNYTIKDRIDATLSQSITAHDFFWNSNRQFAYEEDPEYTSDKGLAYLKDNYNLPDTDTQELLDKSNSMDELVDRADDKKRQSKQIELIASEGVLGYGAVMATGILDIPTLLLGGGIGKVATSAIKTFELANTGAKVTQAVAGAATAVGSVAMLEGSLGNDLTNGELAANAGLGFGIGYVLAGGKAHLPNPKTNAAVKKFIDGKSDVKFEPMTPDNFKKQNLTGEFMYPPSEILKASDNPNAREAGYKLTRTMDGDIPQTGTTVNDVKSEVNKILVDANGEWTNFENHFKSITGRKLTLDDEVQINKIGSEIDYELSKTKKATIKKLTEEKIAENINAAQTEHINIAKQIDEMYTPKIDEIVNSKFTPEPLPEKQFKYDRVLERDIESKGSMRKRQQTTARNKKNAEKFEKAKIREIKKLKKEMNSRYEQNQKALDKKVKDIRKTQIDEDTIAVFEKQARDNAAKRLEQLYKSVPKEYLPAVQTVQKAMQRYGDYLAKLDVDGLKHIDTTFHWVRQYNVDKVAQNPEGARYAFKQALASNFDRIDDELNRALDMEAKYIVDKLLSAKSSFDTFNLNLDMRKVKYLTDEEKGLAKHIASRLKGRKLDLNAAYLTDFMNNDILRNLKSYNDTIGGKIAVKKVLGIDKNFTPREYANAKGITDPKDLKQLSEAIEQAVGTLHIDPQSNTPLSRIVSFLTGLNFFNFSGWFGINTTVDITNVMNDFKYFRTMKYLTKDLKDALNKAPKGKSFARYLGYGAESIMNERAFLYGGEDFPTIRMNKIERAMRGAEKFAGKLSGMDMVVDMMDRVSSLTTLDYIMTEPFSAKFVKNMNRLGLTMKDIEKLRSTKGFIEWDNINAIKKVNLDKLDAQTRAVLERGVRRSIRDTVLKGGGLDAPVWLTRFLGSHSLAKAVFQFMRFPVISYNKLGRKMLHNWDTVDAVVSTATAAAMLGLISQMKDIGKEKPSYDLSTSEGQVRVADYVIGHLPNVAIVGLVQSQMDIVGRILQGDEYHKRAQDINMGVTIQRLQRFYSTAQRYLDGDASASDVIFLKSFIITNPVFLQPFNNMANDEIKDIMND